MFSTLNESPCMNCWANCPGCKFGCSAYMDYLHHQASKREVEKLEKELLNGDRNYSVSYVYTSTETIPSKNISYTVTNRTL